MVSLCSPQISCECGFWRVLDIQMIQIQPNVMTKRKKQTGGRKKNCLCGSNNLLINDSTGHHGLISYDC